MSTTTKFPKPFEACVPSFNSLAAANTALGVGMMGHLRELQLDESLLNEQFF